MQHPTFVYDATGKITGYKTQAGADTVFPFSSNNFILGSRNDVENNLYPTKSGYHRLILAGDGGGEYRYLKAPVDLTNRNKIIFHIYDEINPYSGTTRYVGVAKTPPTSVSSANANTNKVGGTVNVSSDVALELDVSNLSGEYYLFWTDVSVDSRYYTRTNIVAVELK